MPAIYELDHYLLRRKVLKILGAGFHVYDRSGALVAYCQQKAFKLREDIRVFEDEAQTRPLLRIQARQAIDFSASYDIVDETTGEKVGAARRKGFGSLVRDSWEVLDAHDKVLDRLQEDSLGKALARRFLSNLIPQRFVLGKDAVLRQHFNPFVYRLEVDLGPNNDIDPRLVFGTAALIAAIEERQE
jgi:hypothetical protein